MPAAPAGQVTVTGRLHAPESRAGAPEPFGGGLAVRRIGPAELASAVPYPLYGAYVTMDGQVPPADPAFVPIPADHENAAMNAGYVVQWWAFAAADPGRLRLPGPAARRTRRSSADPLSQAVAGLRGLILSIHATALARSAADSALDPHNCAKVAPWERSRPTSSAQLCGSWRDPAQWRDRARTASMVSASAAGLSSR